MSQVTSNTERELKRRRRERERYAYETRAFYQMLTAAGLAHQVHALNEGQRLTRAQATQYANGPLCCAECLAGNFCSQFTILD